MAAFRQSFQAHVRFFTKSTYCAFIRGKIKRNELEGIIMVATILYWGVVAALCGWWAWTAIFSAIYVSNHENGNLWFFAILNTLGLIAAGIFYWIMSNTAWQKYWFTDTVKTGNWLLYVIIAYVVLIILQVILGRTPKEQATA